jgi:hypothetical protein
MIIASGGTEDKLIIGTTAGVVDRFLLFDLRFGISRIIDAEGAIGLKRRC